MARQALILGATANDGTGEGLRDAGVKINSNFQEVYQNVNTLEGNITTIDGNINTLTSTTTTHTTQIATLTTDLNVAEGNISQNAADITTLETTVNGLNVPNLASVGESIIPDTDVTYDLGSSSNRFRDIYLSGNSVNMPGGTISFPSSGGLSVNQSVIGVDGFYDTSGDQTAETTAVTFSTTYGPYTTGVKTTSNFGAIPMDPIYEYTYGSSNEVTGIASVLDAGDLGTFTGAGDDYPLIIGPADASNEPYEVTGFVINPTGPASGFTAAQHTAVYTAANSETLSITYTITEPGSVTAQDFTVDSFVQSGAFAAGEVIANPDQQGYDANDWGWHVDGSDPTVLYWGAANTGDSIALFPEDTVSRQTPLSSTDTSESGGVFQNINTSVNKPTSTTASTVNVTSVISLSLSYVEPMNPADGTIALADGLYWDPLSNNKKSLVIYLDSQWRQIAVGGV